MIRHILILLYILLPCSLSIAQTGSNPFDLTPRVKAAEIKSTAEQEANQVFVPANPFDIKRTEVQVVEKNSIVEVIDEANYENPEEIKQGFKRFTFIVLMGILVLMTTSFTLFRHNFIKAWRSFLNDNMLRQVHREQGEIADFPYLIMNFIFFINIALFIIISLNYYNISFSSSNWLTLLYLLLGVTIIFFIKHLLLKIIGSIFPLSKEMHLYAFTITTFCSILGIILIPLNLSIAYLPENLTLISIWTTIGIIGFIYLFRIMRGFFIGSRYLATNQFHFLLYICTVEIAPTLILLRFILNQS